MPRDNCALIEELTWSDARSSVAGTCKTLAGIFDKISPKDKFIKIRYQFGMKILEDGLFHLPLESGISVPITDTRIPQNIRDKLSYNLFPLGIVVKNSVEVFREIDDKVFSVAFFSKGFDLGIWEHFGWATPYTVTSGARSLYMLPKISDVSSHKKLRKEFGVTAQPPKRLYDHWQVFTQLANSHNFPKEWHCEIIFLTKEMVEKIKNNLAWRELSLYLWQKGWQHSDYARKKSVLDVAWEILSRSISDKLKTDSRVIDTLKHLIFIATSTVPASAPSVGDDEAGPLKDIQLIYENAQGYGLKEYIPSIMQPHTLSACDRSVYYSLQMPTLLESVPKSKKMTSVIDNIRDLQEILNYFIGMDSWAKLQIAGFNLHEIINKLKFEYFHGEAFAYGNDIRPSTEMPRNDSFLIYDPLANSRHVFASNSTFLRGCVRVSFKDCKNKK